MPWKKICTKVLKYMSKKDKFNNLKNVKTLYRKLIKIKQR